MDKQILHIVYNGNNYNIGYCSIPFHEKDKEHLFATLSEQEQATANKFRVSKRALQYVAGRYAAKQALALLTNDTRHTDITIAIAEWGFPYIESGMHSGYNLSISHTDTIAVAICAPQELAIGLDIEVCKPQNETLILSQLSEQEKMMVSGFKEGDRCIVLHAVWSMKEAAGKALKTGFRLPMSLFEISDIQFLDGKFIGQFKVLNILTGYSIITDNIILALAVPTGCKIADDFVPTFSNAITQQV